MNDNEDIDDNEDTSNIDLEHISHTLHAAMNDIIGSDQLVHIRRTTTNICDDVLKMDYELNDSKNIPLYSGSKAEGLRFKSSDDDWMFICKTTITSVIPSDSYAPLLWLQYSAVIVGQWDDKAWIHFTQSDEGKWRCGVLLRMNQVPLEDYQCWMGNTCQARSGGIFILNRTAIKLSLMDLVQALTTAAMNVIMPTVWNVTFGQQSLNPASRDSTKVPGQYIIPSLASWTTASSLLPLEPSNPSLLTMNGGCHFHWLKRNSFILWTIHSFSAMDF